MNAAVLLSDARFTTKHIDIYWIYCKIFCLPELTEMTFKIRINLIAFAGFKSHPALLLLQSGMFHLRCKSR